MNKVQKTCRNSALALSLLFVGLPAAQAAGTTGTDAPATTTTTQDTATPPATTAPATTQQDDGGNWGWIGLLGLLGLAGLMGRNRDSGRNVVVDGTKR